MKKFTLFMLAACAWFATATSSVAEDTTQPTVASTPTAASSLTSGYYVVKMHCKGVEGYLKCDASASNNRVFVETPTSDMGTILNSLNSNADYVWYLNKLIDGDGTFTLQNASSGYFIPAENDNNKNMTAARTFANAAILKAQDYTVSSSSSYTKMDGGVFLACTNYTEIDRQIHCNTYNEVNNLSYWGSGVTTTDGSTVTLAEFAFYPVSDFTLTDESNIVKSEILPVSETLGTTTRKWAGVSGSTYTIHTDVSGNYVNVGFAYTTTAPTMKCTPEELTLSASNHTFTITMTEPTYTAVSDVFGKYYRIVTVNNNTATNNNRYLASQNATAGTDGTWSENSTPIRTNASASYLPQIWQLEQSSTSGKVHFKNVNTGGYLKGTWGAAKLDASASNAGDYTIVAGTGKYSDFDADSHFELQDVNGGQLNAFQGLGASAIGAWADYYDKGSYWMFEKVESVPVTISSTAQYATIGLPFAVSVPEGVKAYTAENAANGYITLKEITGVIPANTGAILYKKDGGDVTLTISSENNTSIGNNLLTATTARRTGYTAGDTYVLALNGTQAAFLKSDLTVVPANKAYIAASKLTASSSNVLNFDFGQTTGINTLDTVDGTDAPTAFYDLNGRRVLYPAHGIYVTAKGKKVLVK